MTLRDAAPAETGPTRFDLYPDGVTKPSCAAFL